MRVIVLGMIVVFLSWAGFQYNDLDAIQWIVVYAISAVLGILLLIGRFSRRAAILFLGFCVVYGLYLSTRVVIAREFFFDEQGREAMGLFICAAWAGFLLHRFDRLRSRSQAAVSETSSTS